MELPKRKHIRLNGYDYSSQGIYYITICTHNRLHLFGEIVGGDAHIAPNIELSHIGMVVEKYIKNIIGIDKYCIMPDHIHLIIIQMNDNRYRLDQNRSMLASTPTRSIPQTVRSLKTLVTKEIGKSIWQRNYYEHIIRDEEDYKAIWQYIDENPLKWEIKRND